MCLYWSCNDEQGSLKVDVGVNWCEMMLANAFNYRVSKYLYPKMFNDLKVFKPFGFRDFAASDSPLNIFGGFNYQYNSSRQSYEVKVFQEAFKTFPGAVRRIEDGANVPN